MDSVWSGVKSDGKGDDGHVMGGDTATYFTMESKKENGMMEGRDKTKKKTMDSKLGKRGTKRKDGKRREKERGGGG